MREKVEAPVTPQLLRLTNHIRKTFQSREIIRIVRIERIFMPIIPMDAYAFPKILQHLPDSIHRLFIHMPRANPNVGIQHPFRYIPFPYRFTAPFRREGKRTIPFLHRTLPPLFAVAYHRCPRQRKLTVSACPFRRSDYFRIERRQPVFGSHFQILAGCALVDRRKVKRPFFIIHHQELQSSCT